MRSCALLVVGGVHGVLVVVEVLGVLEGWGGEICLWWILRSAVQP